MLQTTKNITLGITDSNTPKLVEVKKGDIHTRFVNIKLVDDSDVFEIPENTTARITCIKPDGTYVYNDVDISDSIIEVELTDNMLSAEGKARCEIELYNDGALLTSAEFLLDIQHTLRDERRYESTDEFSAFINALKKVDDLKDISEQLIADSRACIDEALEYKNAAEASALQASASESNVSTYADNAQNAATRAVNAQLSAQGLASQVAQSAQVTAHPPQINNNGNWDIWDTTTSAYADSGINATGVDGVSIVRAMINNSGRLFLTLSSGASIDCGLVVQDISGKEDTSNKVTSLSANSTDAQYPSAKCVYDLIGDVSTAISAINTIIGGNA